MKSWTWVFQSMEQSLTSFVDFIVVPSKKSSRFLLMRYTWGTGEKKYHEELKSSFSCSSKQSPLLIPVLTKCTQNSSHQKREHWSFTCLNISQGNCREYSAESICIDAGLYGTTQKRFKEAPKRTSMRCSPAKKEILNKFQSGVSNRRETRANGLNWHEGRQNASRLKSVEQGSTYFLKKWLLTILLES